MNTTWSARASHAFRKYGLGIRPDPKEVAERLTAVDLLKVPNCGRGTVNGIAVVLRTQGLNLRVTRSREDVW